MSVHKLEVVAEGGELRFELRCTATAGADCRMRPTDDRESWSVGDPGLVPGECWAVDYIAAGTFEEFAQVNPEGVIASLPVSVEYDEAVAITVVPEHTMLPEPPPIEAGEHAPYCVHREHPPGWACQKKCLSCGGKGLLP
jgi:hypothetical protein